MVDFKDKICPICNKSFLDGDDIVVCPECGTPYHRSCYSIENKCIYENRHNLNNSENLNESAVPKETPENEESFNVNNTENTDNVYNSNDKTESEKICPRCKHQNPIDASFCNNCGQFLKSSNEVFEDIPPEIKDGVPVLFDPMGGVDPEEKVDDVKFGDLAKLVKSNTPYYMNIFKKIKNENKSKFNFSAFLFNGLWFLFRKQYKIGIPLTILNFVILSYTSLIQYTQDASKALTSFSGILEALSLLQFAVMLICGFFANRLYFKFCVDKIKSIKEDCAQNNELDYNKEILIQGGTNIRIVFLIFLLSFLISQYLPIFFLGGKI